MTAALAAAQALALIDRGGAFPVTVNGTLEVVLPDWRWRRRTWPPHPACGCGAPGVIPITEPASVQAAGAAEP
jgi:hypothetical protein